MRNKMKDTKKIQMVIDDLKSIKRTVKSMERELKELRKASHNTAHKN